MEHRTEPKNLVICCDGPRNETSENISNVLKLRVDRNNRTAAEKDTNEPKR